MRVLLRRLALPLAATLAVASCSHGAQVTAATAPGFVATGHGVSIVGVMKDGRLHPEAWTWIGAELSRPFGGGSCEAAFSERLRHDDPALFAFADREAKEKGVTEALLARFAERADGDLLLVFELWGDPPRKRGPGMGDGAPTPMGTPGAPTHAGGSGVGARGMGARGMSGARGPDARVRRMGDEGSYGLAVSVYAPATKQWVAAAKLTDAGASSEEGVRRLAEELGRLLPGAKCAGWSRGAGAASASGAAPASATATASASASASATGAAPESGAAPAAAGSGSAGGTR